MPQAPLGGELAKGSEQGHEGVPEAGKAGSLCQAAYGAEQKEKPALRQCLGGAFNTAAAAPICRTAHLFDSSALVDIICRRSQLPVRKTKAKSESHVMYTKGETAHSGHLRSAEGSTKRSATAGSEVRHLKGRPP